MSHGWTATFTNPHLDVELILNNFGMALLFSASKKNDIWVIVDQIIKSTNFLSIWDTWEVRKLAQLYVKEIVQFHEILTDIVSDRDQRFQARFFWQALQKALGTKLNFSSSIILKEMGKLKE